MKLTLSHFLCSLSLLPTSADALFAHLVSKHKPVTYDRVEGANHSFRIKAKPKRDGWRELFGRVGEWFLRP